MIAARRPLQKRFVVSIDQQQQQQQHAGASRSSSSSQALASRRRRSFRPLWELWNKITRKPTRLIWLVVASVLLVWFSFHARSLFTDSIQSNENPFTIATAQRQQSSSAAHNSGTISPFASRPPPIMALNRTVMRHECLASIRQRQYEVLQPYFTKSTTQVLLVDPAYHSNVGDHMITLGELQFLSQFAQNIQQCSYTQAGSFVPPCRNVLAQLHMANKNNDTMVAVWHGGGNFGNLWPLAQQARIASLAPLLQAGYTVVAFPNSWYYTDTVMQQRDVQQLRYGLVQGLLGPKSQDEANAVSDDDLRQLASHRVVWTWREHESYQRGIEQLPYCTHLLVPDIAFQLGPYQKMPPSRLPAQNRALDSGGSGATDLVFLLRDDKESLYAAQRNRQTIRQLVQDTVPLRELTFSIVDWKDRLVRFDSTDIFFTETAIQLLSMGKVLICDRLHAAILAYLVTDMPFVYLDQLTGKISKTLRVAMESGPACQAAITAHMWSAVPNLTEAIRQAEQWLDQVDQQQQPASDTTLTRKQRRDLLRKKMG
jgi:exopolysaccharide biosynthesis predicted pyruvyltransferase EpsI